MGKKKNYFPSESKIGTKVLCWLVAIIAFILIVASLVLSHLPDTKDIATVRIVSDVLMTVGTVALSAAGVSLLLEMTTTRKNAVDFTETAISNLFKERELKDYIISRMSSNDIFDLLFLSYYEDENILKLHPISNNLKQIFQRIFTDDYAESKNMRMNVTIDKDWLFEKIVERDEVIIKANKNPYVYESELACLSGTLIVVEEFSINGDKYDIKPIKVDNSKFRNTISYDDIYVLKFECPKISEDNRYECHIKLKYTTRNDFNIFYANRHLCKRLNHSIYIKSVHPIEIESVIFTLPNEGRIVNKDKYIIRTHGKDNNVEKYQDIDFNDWSFPGDSYGCVIRKMN